MRKILIILKTTRGAAMVELAIIAPLLFILLFAIIEVGAVLYNQAVVTNASREGARYAATYYTNPANATAQRPDCPAIQTFVVTYVNAHFLSFVNPTPFNTSNVSCPDGNNPYRNAGGYAGYVDTIRIQYNYDFLVLGNLMRLLGGGMSPSWTLHAQTAMRDENQAP